MRTIIKTLLASSIFLAAGSIAQADELNLAAVTSQFELALADLTVTANAENLHVLPLRTNTELQAIAIECEAILSGNDTDVAIPSICAALDLPLDGQGSERIESAEVDFLDDVEMAFN